jgi:predicted phosphate transport protein (TIGR00153 family)
MAVGSPIGKLFGVSPIKPLQEHMQLAGRAVGELCQLVRAAADQDSRRMQELREQLLATAREAARLRHEIRSHLPRGLFLAMPRPDLLELVAAQDAIPAQARDIARRVLFRPLAVPAPARRSLESLLRRCEGTTGQALTAIRETDELLETGFGGGEARRVEKLLDSLDRRVVQSDLQADKLRALLARAETDTAPLDAAFNYRLVDGIDDLAHAAGDVGERLRLLLAH